MALRLQFAQEHEDVRRSAGLSIGRDDRQRLLGCCSSDGNMKTSNHDLLSSDPLVFGQFTVYTGGSNH